MQVIPWPHAKPNHNPMNPTQQEILNPQPAERRKGVDRRNFLKLAGSGSLAMLASRMPVMAGPFVPGDFEKLVPSDKKLSPEWLKSLFDRGAPQVYRGKDLELIGMPVGGLCSGQLYLGGDGRLWHWDIFNQHVGTSTNGDHYAKPMTPTAPLEQGFSLRVGEVTKALDKTGFKDVSFRGEYPLGIVDYREPELPVEVRLEAFSPFIPLNVDDSSHPATVMQFTVKNTGSKALDVELTGRLENAVCLGHRNLAGTRRNRIVHGAGFTFLECSAGTNPAPAAVAPRPDVLFEDWHQPTYQGWTAEGNAFGSGPILKKDIPAYQGDVGGDTERVVNSHASATGDVTVRDNATGKLTSRPFKIERNFIQFWIGGGNHAGKTCLNLLVDGKVVQSATGQANNLMSVQQFDVQALAGKQAIIEIVDAQQGAWGNIGVGRITFTDKPAVSGALDKLPDFGTMGLALLGEVAGHTSGDATAPLADKLVGQLGRSVALAPGKSAVWTFVLTWHFPNLQMHNLPGGRHYATTFASALAVAEGLAANFPRLYQETKLWRDTWYDSTLPYWFLDRTFLTLSTLATSTCFRFGNGRFYGWEGVGCCQGTCTHVWHYAHGPARLFPQLERDTRERVDLGLSLDAASGVSGFRGEFDRGLAVDGQCGTLLRIYREHQMAVDDGFLKRNWPNIKKMFDPLFKLDGNDDGLLEGAQMNTLDQAWFGKIAWLSSLYLAALRAGEAMATEVGETEFAGRCRAIAALGSKNIDAQLFNGEYYHQTADKNKAKTVGSFDGCEIDQVFGQSWAWQVGLGRILPQDHVKTALQSLWRYNFTPDVGPWRNANKPGRWYAMAGEGGLIMCTWPKGDAQRVQTGFDFYFNECMNGFEYQAAGHMLWEGMAMEGLAVTRAIHDRYDASRRNPWNEIECGDHYARSMAGYGVFTAASGFEYHGPHGHIGFAPRLTPADFKCAFTSAEGWGRFSQKIAQGKTTADLALLWGKLRVNTLALAATGATAVQVTLNGKALAAKFTTEGSRLLITLGSAANMSAGDKLEVAIS